MENNYLIAGIKVQIKYHYDDYLKGSIEQYRLDHHKVDHSFHVHLEDHISYDEEIEDDKQTVISFKHQKRIIYAFNHEKKVKGMISYDLDFKQVDIHIVPSIIKNPAEVEYTLLGLIFLEMTMMYGFLPWHAFSLDDLNLVGEVIIKIYATGSDMQATFDNFVWE